MKILLLVALFSFAATDDDPLCSRNFELNQRPAVVVAAMSVHEQEIWEAFGVENIKREIKESQVRVVIKNGKIRTELNVKSVVTFDMKWKGEIYTLTADEVLTWCPKNKELILNFSVRENELLDKMQTRLTLCATKEGTEATIDFWLEQEDTNYTLLKMYARTRSLKMQRTMIELFDGKVDGTNNKDSGTDRGDQEKQPISSEMPENDSASYSSWHFDSRIEQHFDGVYLPKRGDFSLSWV